MKHTLQKEPNAQTSNKVSDKDLNINLNMKISRAPQSNARNGEEDSLGGPTGYLITKLVTARH